MDNEVESGQASAVQRATLAAASLINAVGSLVEQLVEMAARPKADIAKSMGVTPARVSQLLVGDGNVRIATLARLAEACGADLSLTATLRESGGKITVPRTSQRGRRSPGVAGPPTEESRERGSLKAAALVNAVASLMEEVVAASGATRGSVATAMGVTPGRVTQLLDGDGNVRISTLARLVEASGADLIIVATDRRNGTQISVPRQITRHREDPAAQNTEVVDLESQRERRASRGQSPKRTQQEVRARVRQICPVVNKLVKRGVLPAEPIELQEQALCGLFGIESIWQMPEFAAAARRHNEGESVTALQTTWLACARRAARTQSVDRYDEMRLEELASGLSRLLVDPNRFVELPSLFASVGVRLIWVEPFNGNKISGVAFPLDHDPAAPVIALSGRGQRLDKVLFTLLHEIAHVRLGHLDGGWASSTRMTCRGMSGR
ncbi:MAG: helix-turn-helix transcriptional regulator [Nigerium sp.]|nr:helix-turn-helix transcriptional regulator [Nigerium sp.]